MSETPLVSFVLPTHNRLEWVGEAVSSILSQSEKNIELVIVNDGSTDGTKEFLEEWLKDEKRVKLIHNETSMGGGYSRHLGAQHATGEIICVMDDDDVCVDERVKNTLNWFKEHPESEMVNFPIVLVGYNNEILDSRDGAEFDHEMFKKTGSATYFSNPTVAMKKKSYFETEGYKKETEEKTDDYQFLENWVKAGKKVDFCPGDPVVMHRTMPDSMMSKKRGWIPEWVTGG